MRNLNIVFFILFLSFSSLFAFKSDVDNLSNKDKLKIAFGANKPPFMFELGSNSGMEYDIIKESFATKGYDVEPLQLTYSKLASALLDDKTIDGAAGVQKRKNDPYFHSNNYITFNNYAYTKVKNNIRLNSFEDLKGKSIAIWGDGHKHLGDEFYKLFNPINREEHTPEFYEINDQKEQVSALFNGMADVVIIDKKIFHWQKNSISSSVNTNFEIKEHKLFENSTGFNVSFRDSKINDIFNDGLKQLKQSGRYEQIVSMYTDKNYQFYIDYLKTVSKIYKYLILEDNIEAIRELSSTLSGEYDSLYSLELIDRFGKRIAYYENKSEKEKNINSLEHNIFQLDTQSGINNKIGVVKLEFLNNKEKEIFHDFTFSIKSAKTINDITKAKMLKSLKSYLSHKTIRDKVEFTKKELKWIKKHQQLSFVGDTTLEPLAFIDKDTKSYSGLSYDFLEYISKYTGIKFKMVETKSWHDSLNKLKNKQADMIICIKQTKEREEFMNFSLPYIDYPSVIVSKKGESYISDISELNGKKVVAIKSSAVATSIEKNHSKIELVFVNDVQDALVKVLNNEVYAYVEVLPVVSHSINKKGFLNLKIIGQTKYNYPLSFAIRNDIDSTGINIFNKVLNSMTMEEKAKITQKWISIKVQEKIDYKLLIRVGTITLIIFLIILYWNRKLSKEIKKRKKAQLELIEYKEALFTKSKAVMLFIDPKTGEVVDCNERAISYYGYSHKELTKKYIFQINQLSKEEIEKEMENAKKEKRNSFYFKHKLKNGEVRDVEVHSGPIDLKGRKLLYSVVHDITEQKRQEKLMLEQSKLVSMGEMIGNIAHQWRQPLSVISSGATGLQVAKDNDMLSDELFESACNSINDNAQYLSKTIDDFRDFIKGERRKVNFYLSDNINSFLHLVEGTIKNNNIKLVTSIDESILVDGYPNELIQCFINIFNNAKDALKEVLDDKYIFIEIKENQNSVSIVIKDNAGGVPEKVLPHIFEPYFTTKHKSQGTGLGLSMTYSLVVDGMNGTISVVNENYEYKEKNYKGACFTIVLPK